MTKKSRIYYYKGIRTQYIRIRRVLAPEWLIQLLYGLAAEKCFAKEQGKEIRFRMQKHLHASIRRKRNQRTATLWCNRLKGNPGEPWPCSPRRPSPCDWTLHLRMYQPLSHLGTLDHLTCLLSNLYAGQEATVRTGHGTTDWFQIGKGVRQGCILSPCLFNLYAEYIVRNAGLEEAQAGIKIAGRNINNLRYTDDTTLIAESEELKSLLKKWKRRVRKLA